MDVQNLMKYVSSRPTQEPSLKDLASLKSQLAELSSKYVDLSKLQDGETLKGEVTNIEQKVLEVLTNKGQLFKGTLADNLPVNIGETREFIVNNKNGNSTLSLVDLPKEEAQNTKILDTLKELGLKGDEKNLQIAKEILSNKLPLNKETLSQVKGGMYFIENSENSENALSKSIFLAKNNITPTKETVDTLNNINDKNNTLAKNIDTIFSKVAVLEDKTLGKELSKLLENFKPQTTNATTENKSAEGETLQKNIQTKAMEQELPKDKAPLNNEPVLKETQIKQTESTLLFDKDGKPINKDLDLPLLDEANIDETTQDKSKLDNKDASPFEKLKNPKEFFKDVEENLSDLKDKLTKAMSLLEKKDDEASQGLKNELKALNNKLDFYNDLKNNTFLQFPLNINKEQNEVNLKIFKDKKDKKSDDDPISALLSLYTENLGLFGTYVQKHKKNLNIQFRLEDKETETLVMQNINTLKGILQPLHYNIESITFKNAADSQNVETEEKDILEINDYNQRIVFDVKG
ncbi:MAG: hypothetical protein ACK5LY_01785 [Lachnospirales bacterium]